MTSPPPKNLIPADPLYLIIIYRESTEWDCLQIAGWVQPLGSASAVAWNGFNNWVCWFLFNYRCPEMWVPITSTCLRHRESTVVDGDVSFEQHSPVRKEYPNEGGKASLIILSKAEMGALKTQWEKSTFYIHLSWRVSLNCKYRWHNPR